MEVSRYLIGVLGARELALMKPGAILVNTARAQLVDEAALNDAVLSGRIMAGLDVFYREPLPAELPYLGYGAIEVYREYYAVCVETALAWRAGKPIRVMQAPA